MISPMVLTIVMLVWLEMIVLQSDLVRQEDLGIGWAEWGETGGNDVSRDGADPGPPVPPVRNW